MHESLPEEHRRGVEAFVESLEHKSVRCTNCGFESGLLHGDWQTAVHTEPRSGHLRYELTCPDCGTVETVEINV
ncbi:MAG: hypothetical protein M8354_03785 [Halalkalicoccus sp.]|nr:hypothetical protein [Halalkalicoccus sp.]